MVVDYKGIIGKYSNKAVKPTEIKGIFASLREAGVTRQDLTKELQGHILGLFENNRTKQKQEKFNVFILDLIAFFTASMLKSNPKSNFEELDGESESNVELRPKKSKMHYDYEFLKQVGWENPDG